MGPGVYTVPPIKVIYGKHTSLNYLAYAPVASPFSEDLLALYHPFKFVKVFLDGVEIVEVQFLLQLIWSWGQIDVNWLAWLGINGRARVFLLFLLFDTLSLSFFLLFVLLVLLLAPTAHELVEQLWVFPVYVLC